jgi:hypothetical protein
VVAAVDNGVDIDRRIVSRDNVVDIIDVVVHCWSAWTWASWTSLADPHHHHHVARHIQHHAMPGKYSRVSSNRSRFNPFVVNSKVDSPVEMSKNDSDVWKIATANCDERRTIRTTAGPNPSGRIKNHRYAVEKRSRSLELSADNDVKAR